MSLKHGLLGFLNYGPKSGYDLYKMFFKPLRPAPSLIYRKLNEMAEDGLVTSNLIEQKKRPNRNVFCITEVGRKELVRWLRYPLRHAALEDTESIQLWYSSNIDKADVISNIKDLIKHLKKERDYYEKEATILIEIGQPQTAKPLDRFYWKLVVKEAIAILEFRIKLSEGLIKKIKEYEEVEAENRSQRRQIKR
jgi:DNA-binding PadR family transcriptional regulator